MSSSTALVLQSPAGIDQNAADIFPPLSGISAPLSGIIFKKTEEHIVNAGNLDSKMIWIKSTDSGIFAPMRGRIDFSHIPGVLFTIITSEGVLAHVGAPDPGSEHFDKVPLDTLNVIQGAKIYSLKADRESSGSFTSFIGVTSRGQVLHTAATAELETSVKQGALLWTFDSTSTTLRKA